MSEGTTDFQSYLQEELLRRCRANPRYSLRAFARTLATEPSFLSKILNGKRPVTEDTLKRFAARLQLSSRDLEKFRITPSRGRRLRASTLSFVSLDQERFRTISEWHHYAVLELLRIPGFKLEARSVSKMLGISVVEAKLSIQRLDRLEMLPNLKSGSRTPANHTTVGSVDTAVALRAFQKQVLQMAIQALEDIPVEERDQSSMTMAVDRKLLPEVRLKIKEFRRSLDQFIQSSGTPDSVYHLSVSLYPVTQKTKGCPQ